ncbi:MAG: hypothetical protein M3680_34950, partial [Myxococcota bacterium]|nr:hypothetical protein [Myxococcota bacterium]
PSLGAGFEPTAASPPGGHYAKYPPYSTHPADPWAAVQGDQPRRWPVDEWVVRGDPGDCSAAKDHCLDRDAWFRIKESDRARSPRVMAMVNVAGATRWLAPQNARGDLIGEGEDYTAYRTVPATRANFVPGTIALGLARNGTIPANGQAAIELTWWFGVVEEVDLELGVYKLAGHTDTLLLAGARTAVLAWKPGQAVQILGGKRRDQLAVRPQDTFAPHR